MSRTTRPMAPVLCILVASFLTACRAAPGSSSAGPLPPGNTPAAPSASPVPGACPLGAPAQWQTFLEQRAGDARWVETCEDSACDKAYYRFVDQEVQGVFAKCADVLAQSSAIGACTEHLRTFVPTWLRMHDASTYGFVADNKTYLAKEEAANLPPGMMTVPEALSSALPSRLAVEAAARANGWRYLTHDSGLIGGRVFVDIRDPQDRFDQWYLFNFAVGPDGRAGAGINTVKMVSMLAAQTKDAQGTPLPAVRLHFRDLHPDPTGPATFHLTAAADGNGKCFGCHPSGVRRLIPIQTSVLDARPVKGEPGYDPSATAPAPPGFAAARLQEFNARLDGYGLPDWEGNVDQSTMGPALGAGQGCTGCHNGTDRGVLTVLTSTEQLHEKMQVEYAMPPEPGTWSLVERNITKSPPLSTAELATLEQSAASHNQAYAQFMAARLPALKAWLLETPCL